MKLLKRSEIVINLSAVYSPDMPKRLPIRDIINGLFGSLATAVRFWLHYTLVAVAWLGIVPLTACKCMHVVKQSNVISLFLLADRIYRCLFSGSFSSILTLPLDLLSTENLVSDGFYGCCVVTCTLCAFISLVWLREQILRGGGPEWLDPQQQQQQQDQNAPVGEAVDVAAPVINDNNNINNNNNGEQAVDEAVDEAVGLLDQVDLEDEQVLDDPDDPVENVDEPNDNNALVNAQDDINWNPVEWDRAADELTWERVSL